VSQCFPFQVWQPLYDAVLDSVQKVSKMAVLVGLVGDGSNFPAFRRGDELWKDRLEFAALNVAVSPDCSGSQNLLFVPIRVPLAVATGAPTDPDLVLTPAELAVLNAQIHAMNAHIHGHSRREFADFVVKST
jgi:hypothetical protein